MMLLGRVLGEGCGLKKDKMFYREREDFWTEGKRCLGNYLGYICPKLICTISIRSYRSSLSHLYM